MRITKGYIVQEILDLISLKQLNNEKLPELSGDRIEAIAESIIFDWNEIGDPEANLDECIKWNFEQNLTHW
jgi:hypothetical protein